ncbi:MAG: hypothetical protein ACLVJ6_01420 [Merdibacter sp.]
MAVVVNEVFNQYIQKANYQEPYYAEYCDGKIASCPGMKQWGTLSLANQGYTAIEILRYYYGDSILIRESNNIQDIQASYPQAGLIQRAGSAEMQNFQWIAINYPAIPVIFPGRHSTRARKLPSACSAPVQPDGRRHRQGHLV